MISVMHKKTVGNVAAANEWLPYAMYQAQRLDMELERLGSTTGYKNIILDDDSRVYLFYKDGTMQVTVEGAAIDLYKPRYPREDDGDDPDKKAEDETEETKYPLGPPPKMLQMVAIGTSSSDVLCVGQKMFNGPFALRGTFSKTEVEEDAVQKGTHKILINYPQSYITTNDTALGWYAQKNGDSTTFHLTSGSFLKNKRILLSQHGHGFSPIGGKISLRYRVQHGPAPGGGLHSGNEYSFLIDSNTTVTAPVKITIPDNFEYFQGTLTTGILVYGVDNILMKADTVFGTQSILTDNLDWYQGVLGHTTTYVDQYGTSFYHKYTDVYKIVHKDGTITLPSSDNYTEIWWGSDINTGSNPTLPLPEGSYPYSGTWGPSYYDYASGPLDMVTGGMDSKAKLSVTYSGQAIGLSSWTGTLVVGGGDDYSNSWTHSDNAAATSSINVVASYRGFSWDIYNTTGVSTTSVTRSATIARIGHVGSFTEDVDLDWDILSTVSIGYLGGPYYAEATFTKSCICYPNLFVAIVKVRYLSIMEPPPFYYLSSHGETTYEKTYLIFGAAPHQNGTPLNLAKGSILLTSGTAFKPLYRIATPPFGILENQFGDTVYYGNYAPNDGDHVIGYTDDYFAVAYQINSGTQPFTSPVTKFWLRVYKRTGQLVYLGEIDSSSLGNLTFFKQMET